MKLIFFGNPQIAVPILEEIYNSEHQILAVVTNPDKKQGRGMKLLPTPVKKFALEKNIKVLTPQKLSDTEFIEELKSLSADLFVVFAFKKLPTEVWQIPPKGTFNLHASYLPQYRGAAPINWAIINGESYTGVSTFFINDVIDSGKIILRKKIPIDFEDNATTLTLKIIEEGKKITLETINLIEKGNFKLTEQDEIPENQLKKAPKLTKEMCKIDWNKSALEVYNFIRGLSEFPTAWTFLKKGDKKLRLKIYKAQLIETNDKKLNSYQVNFDKKNIYVHLNNGTLKLAELQPEGKKRMTAEEFLRGFNDKEILFE